ncbi:kelch-like protein 10 [Nilaparvata lugens]|uniref:kelch-like protein 10 n=1 Tax=Nilaparvata lugens TaxID=108931 RepID=UPI000B9940F9|nr:kelch-like protein 10 [Nilaparvata lugens]
MESLRNDAPEGSIENSSCQRDISVMSSQALQALYELREERLLCDATIKLDNGEIFYVHRAIISACSSYFRTLFTTTLNGKDRTKIELPGVDSNTMKLILEYVYLRRLRITSENVGTLLVTADFLGLLGIIHLCCQFLKKHINPKNCMGILKFARDHFCYDLEDEVLRYILRDFVTIAGVSEEIVHMEVEELCKIIGSDELNVKSEEIVWECALKWMMHDEHNRKFFAVDFMRSIRLGLLETTYFLEKVKEHPFVVGNAMCKPLIIETLRFLYDLEMITQKHGEVATPAIARPRVPHEILFAIGGWSGGSPTNFIETYDTRADRWIKVEEVDSAGPRAYHGTAVIGYKIYVIGGFDGVSYFNTCRCFDAVTKEWKEIAPMYASRCYVSVAVDKDVIYAMGGFDGHNRQNSVEKYDYKANQWTQIAPMNMQRSDASAAALNGKIFITGGFNGQECLSSAEVYDPELNQWTMITPMRSRRSGVSCIAYHNALYVIGGFNGISRMSSGEKYNTETYTWYPIPDMYNPRSNFAIEVIDDMIFAIGGFNGVTTIFHVECFDEKAGEWYEATDMNIYRSALSACVIMGLPNITDYIHKHRELLMEEKRQKLLSMENNNSSGNQQQAAMAIAEVEETENNQDIEDILEENDLALFLAEDEF